MTLVGLGGSTALGTDAGRVIGLATAARLAAESCTVVAADRDAAPLEEAAQSHGLIPPVGTSTAVTASPASLRDQPEFGAYVASEHAVAGLVRTAVIEGGAHCVSVNSVALGQTETRTMDAIARVRAPWEEAASREGLSERVPLGRYSSADEVAATVAWPLSDESTFFNGALVSVDGGVVIP